MFRKVLFWLHLAAGVVAGLVILIMSVTGVALTYERQINEWTTSHLRSVPPTPDARPMPIESLLAEVARTHPGVNINGVTVNARRDAAVTVLAEPAPLYVDAYTGRELGERRGAAIRPFMSSMRAWHRWLAVEGDQRAVARSITGWSNLLFLFIVVSGMYLWLPRVLAWRQIRQVIFFRRNYGTSKARDFNWHNVIGIWSAVPLFVVVLGAVPMSFPWAGDLVYRLAGEEPPTRTRPEGAGGPGGRGGRPSGPVSNGPQGRGGAPVAGSGAEGRAGTALSRETGAPREGGPRAEGDARAEGGPRREGNPRGARGERRGGEAGESAPLVLTGLDLGFARAMVDQRDWRSISVRLPRRADDPLAFAIDRGDGGQPQFRSTLTVTRVGDVTGRETFGDQTTGRQLRSILRFAHTGEVLGIVGQTIAGLVSAGAVVMVWTGLALSFRRLRAWQARRNPLTVDAASVAGTAQASQN
ncbi:MAG: PepSY-associated TM helix domain-containing protein [Vicinamibacterales bacterium]